MKYPLAPAEERLKAKIEKKKHKANQPPTKTYVKRYVKKAFANDFLKYWKVIRYWVRHKYGITQNDLDMLFFLYSEGYFKKTDIREYEAVFSWDKNRFSRLMRDGWIHMFRKPSPGRIALYEISPRGHAMVHDIYCKLNGQVISEDVNRNKMFRNDAKYFEKVHRNYIKKLNQSILQERRRVRVSRLKLRRRESLYAQRHGQSE